MWSPIDVVVVIIIIVVVGFSFVWTFNFHSPSFFASRTAVSSSQVGIWLNVTSSVVIRCATPNTAISSANENVKRKTWAQRAHFRFYLYIQIQFFLRGAQLQYKYNDFIILHGDKNRLLWLCGDLYLDSLFVRKPDNGGHITFNRILKCVLFTLMFVFLQWNRSVARALWKHGKLQCNHVIVCSCFFYYRFCLYVFSNKIAAEIIFV